MKYQVNTIGPNFMSAWLITGYDSEQLNLEGEIIPVIFCECWERFNN